MVAPPPGSWPRVRGSLAARGHLARENACTAAEPAGSGGGAPRRGVGRFARGEGGPLPCPLLEASPSPVYGAALLMRFGLTAHRGFKSLRLRATETPGSLRPGVFRCAEAGGCREPEEARRGTRRGSDGGVPPPARRAGRAEDPTTPRQQDTSTQARTERVEVKPDHLEAAQHLDPSARGAGRGTAPPPRRDGAPGCPVSRGLRRGPGSARPGQAPPGRAWRQAEAARLSASRRGSTSSRARCASAAAARACRARPRRCRRAA